MWLGEVCSMYWNNPRLFSLQKSATPCTKFPEILVKASPPFQCYSMYANPSQKQRLEKKKKKSEMPPPMYVRASRKSLCRTLSLHAKGLKLSNVKKVKLISSSGSQTALVPLSKEMVHVPWHFQPAFFAVRAIAHAYTTFVAARILIIVAHGDHVGSVETSTSHG